MTWDGDNTRSQKRLLYLDDDEDFLRLFSMKAEALGFEVKTLKYASDFLIEFETGTYYAALVDYVLSFADGICVTRLLDRTLAPDTKLYIFTAFDKHLVLRKVNGDKINGILSKANGISEILAEVVNG